MKRISERYSRIFSDYYYEKARERFEFIVQYSDFFLESLHFDEKVDGQIIYLNVEAFITSYFLDVIKFKEYHFNFPDGDGPEVDRKVHGEKLLNASKVGAFTAKWLLKYKPIVLLPKADIVLDTFEQRDIQDAPFILALNIALRSMGVDPREVPEDTYKQLLYHFRFRDYEDRGMILYFDLLLKHIELIRKKL